MIQFLTFQTCVLVILKHLFNLEFINLHFLTMMVLFGGSYITYVKEFVVIHKYDIGHRFTILLNLPFHIIPFLYIWKTYKINKKYLLETLLYLLIYYNLFNPSKTYYFIKHEMEKISIMLFIGLILFFSL
jgi:hypothetical protein